MLNTNLDGGDDCHSDADGDGSSDADGNCDSDSETDCEWDGGSVVFVGFDKIEDCCTFYTYKTYLARSTDK